MIFVASCIPKVLMDDIPLSLISTYPNPDLEEILQKKKLYKTFCSIKVSAPSPLDVKKIVKEQYPELFMLQFKSDL